MCQSQFQIRSFFYCCLFILVSTVTFSNTGVVTAESQLNLVGYFRFERSKSH